MTITPASPQMLAVVEQHNRAALEMAYDMLKQIEHGNSFDALDYHKRMVALKVRLADLEQPSLRGAGWRTDESGTV